MKLSAKVLIVVFAAALETGASTRLFKGKDSPPAVRELQQNKGGGGGGSGGGKPTDPPGEEPPTDVVPDLGDLIRLLRDPSTGVPILTYGQIGDAGPDADNKCEWANVTGGCCLWPLALEDPYCDDNGCVADNYGVRVINSDAIDPLSCSINATCANCTMETDFGRTR